MLKTKSVLGIFVGFGLLVTLAVGAIAQSGAIIGQFNPFAINVQHSEQITVVSTTTVESGEVVTITTPLTLAVDLAINVSGENIVAVSSAGDATTNAQLVIATPEPAPSGQEGFVDAAGIVYTARAGTGTLIGQVQTTETFGKASIIGLIINDSDEAHEFITVSIELYDSDGILLDTTAAIVDFSETLRGESVSFSALSSAELSDLAGYSISTKVEF